MILKQIQAGDENGEWYNIGNHFKICPFEPIETPLGKIEYLLSIDPLNPGDKAIKIRNELIIELTEYFYNKSPGYRDKVWQGAALTEADQTDFTQLPPLYANSLKRYYNVGEAQVASEADLANFAKGVEVFYKEPEKEGGFKVKYGEKNPLAEELLCLDKTQLDKRFPMVTSSATSNNPSIEYVSPEEASAIYTAYFDVLGNFGGSGFVSNYDPSKRPDVFIIFGPSPKSTPISQSAFGRLAYAELAMADGCHYLLGPDVMSPQGISITAVAEKAGRLIDYAVENDKKIALGFSVQLIYKSFEYLKSQGRTWDLGSKCRTATGGGGWAYGDEKESKKGAIRTDAVTQPDYIALLEDVLGMPAGNNGDTFAYSEGPLAVTDGKWSEELNRFEYEILTAFTRAILVDPNDPYNVLQKGDVGHMKMFTPAFAQARHITIPGDLIKATEIKSGELIKFIHTGRDSSTGPSEDGGCGKLVSMNRAVKQHD